LTKAQELGIYDDASDDDKSVEPESVVVTKMGDKTILFWFRKSDAVMVYDVSILLLKILQTFKTGDAPEGLLFPSKVLPKV
jgi:hypothetical protein